MTYFNLFVLTLLIINIKNISSISKNKFKKNIVVFTICPLLISKKKPYKFNVKKNLTCLIYYGIIITWIRTAIKQGRKWVGLGLLALRYLDQERVRVLMSERKLASVQRIDRIRPINGADNIEVAEVLGWECVVKKDEFKQGDLCVYIEIDSIVPDNKPYFSFMKERKYRVRTVKLRGQISQGLVCPLSILGKSKSLSVNVGDSVGDFLHIRKYEASEDINTDDRVVIQNKKVDRFLKRYKWYRSLFQTRAKFPSFIPKTDETRIQSVPEILESLKDEEIHVTEKLDGQSATYFYVKQKSKIPFLTKRIYGVCSRNLWLKKKTDCTWWKISDKYDIEKKLSRLNTNIAIQGEIIGPSVQRNKYDLKELGFYVFGMYDIDKLKYLSVTQTMAICMHLGLKYVPTVSCMTFYDTARDWVCFAVGRPSKINDMKLSEGIVVRTYNQTNKNSIGKISFKVLNNDFLLEHGE
jgi:RNA ligase (TIGR02306 family)